MATVYTGVMTDRKRSRGYPGVNLADTISNLRVVQQGLGLGAHEREAIAKALGHPAETGASNRKIGALSLFGLLDRGPGGYTITNLGKSLLRPLPGEEPELLRSAFLSVPLYQEVFDKYGPEGRLPQHIPQLMERLFGIVAPSGDYASRTMIQSAKYAGLLDDDLSFTAAENVSATAIPESAAGSVAHTSQDRIANQDSRPVISGEQSSARVMLSNPMVEVSAPSSMTQRQKDRVVAWLDKVVKPWLEFQIEESDESEQTGDLG